MRSAKETTVAEHGVIAGVDFIECRQFDLGSGVRDRHKTSKADQVVDHVD
jgi:hypothetical protein